MSGDFAELLRHETYPPENCCPLCGAGENPHNRLWWTCGRGPSTPVDDDTAACLRKQLQREREKVETLKRTLNNVLDYYHTKGYGRVHDR